MSTLIAQVVCTLLIALLADQNAPGADDTLMKLPVIKKDAVTGFSNGGWALDRYPELGYFHATYARKTFQLTDQTAETFFHVKGTGHLLGRQFSVATDEPTFKNYNFVMEGNNEVDIDGRERLIDYLGSEDSFTFSWGFQRTFAGCRAGMPFIQPGTPPFLLSMYRFHDHMPIRFREELKWSINWEYEFKGKGSPKHGEALRQRKDAGGVWMDYATVFYWYQDHPAAFDHEPLAPVAERVSDLLKSSVKDGSDGGR